MSMIEALRDSALHECDVAIHLHGKLPEAAADYRPTPKQRSTVELLRYLSACGIGSARAMCEGEWEGYKEAMGRVEDMPLEGFPEAMQHQKQALEALFEGLTDEDLTSREAVLPWGEKVSLGRALLETTLKWLAAYRMQLFLYAKAAGNASIGTANNWAGVDWED
jgi:hypothetical protein